MMKRRDFIEQLSVASAMALLPGWAFGNSNDRISAFAKKLKPVGRALEMEGYYVWCNSPIEGPDGRIHVFFSRWIASKKMGGWINGSEICHAVADTPKVSLNFWEPFLPAWAGLLGCYYLS
ncbi:hypothetical protein [Mucilaginibacter metallidurans]|uniref:hypothetical protein n=1 Tax=Mucilaginibacter sp. P4 TaxID=3383180 RepID=UPI001FCB5A26|nr:hypothetical protein [Mucilaginibacter gossypii]